MSLTASEDLIIGSKIRVNKTGYWADRNIYITGLDPTRQPGLIFGAVIPNEDGSGSTIAIPTWASLHPTIIGAYAIDVTQEPWPPDSKTGLVVKAQYGPGELVNEWKITVSGSNGTKTLSTDIDGSPLKIQYTPPGGSLQVDYAAAQYLAPGSIVVFEHEEYESPWSKVLAFKSTTNTVSFLGFGAHKVLCRDIEVESFSNMTRWRVRYIFDIDPSQNGWQQILLFEDQYTGQVPSDVTGTDGTSGILEIDPYSIAVGTSDFNTLGLPTAILLGAAGAAPIGPTVDGQFTESAYASGQGTYNYLGGSGD